MPIPLGVDDRAHRSPPGSDIDLERPACEIDPTAGGQAQPTFKRIACGSPHTSARINPLFTMSDSTHRAVGPAANDTVRNQIMDEWMQAQRDVASTRLVEPDGIEPTTSCLQSRRSPN